MCQLLPSRDVSVLPVSQLRLYRSPRSRRSQLDDDKWEFSAFPKTIVIIIMTMVIMVLLIVDGPTKISRLSPQPHTTTNPIDSSFFFFHFSLEYIIIFRE